MTDDTGNVRLLHPEQSDMPGQDDLFDLSTPAQIDPVDAIAETSLILRGQPIFIAGSACAAIAHGRTHYGDIDLFVPTQQVLISTVQSLLNAGYTMDDRFERTWYRWLRYGLKGWHTNSMKLHSLKDVEVNVVYKLVDGHATTSLSQVLESFDFGLLGTGIEVETGTVRDLRPYLFPGLPVNGPLPMMPNKRDNWRRGFVSQYNGLREAGRYAKYHGYGYDLTAVRDDLVTGYEQASIYFLDHYDEDKRLLGEIYLKLADRIRQDEIDELVESYKLLDFTDSLDKIMEGLE